MICRQAKEDEQEAVERLGSTDPETKDFRYLWRRYGNWNEKNNPIIVIDNAIIGFHAAAFGRIYVNSYYQLVAATHRGQGVGGMMVQELVRIGNERGCLRLKFKTPFGTDGERFWRGFGLKPFAKDEKQYLFDCVLPTTVDGFREVNCLDVPERELRRLEGKVVLL